MPAAMALMAPDALEKRPDLWPGGGDDESVEQLIGGVMLPAEVLVVVAELDVLESAAKVS